MATIKVPRTPAKAFDKDRPASDLLRRQIQHLEWARRPASARTPQMLRMPKTMTEGEAAERIEQLTAAVVEQGKQEAARVMYQGAPLVETVAVPPAMAPRPARRQKRATRRRSAGRRKPATKRAGSKTAKSKKARSKNKKR
jgi:hypothetical protein